MKRYLVIADRLGRLTVGVNEEFRARPGDIILYSTDDIDEAFDWKEDMQSRITTLCRSCQEA